MRLRLSLCLVGWFGVCASGQTSFYPGSGSVFTAQFSQAWERDGFNLEVGNPSGNVTNLGSTGLIQLFPSVNTAGATLALVKPDTTQNFNVMQLQAAMYAYYSTLSVTIVGYPTTDTQACPLLHSTGNSADSCQWQPFNNDYALFVYTQPVQSGGQNFGIGDPFYTKWATLGGVSILGPATSGQTQVTSQYGSQATVQTYDQGAIFNITSGLLSGRLIVVAEPVYDLYRTNGGPAGSLGLPATAALLLSNGMFEQTFEGGAIEYNPSTNIAVLEPPIASVTLAPSGSIQLNVGATLMATATVYGNDGSVLTNRTVDWNTSNGQVVQIQANGPTATLMAVGAGLATVTASAAGKTSPGLNISVTATCCQIGEGAPTTAIKQAFQNAVTRNNLSVQLPAASGVTSLGMGYVQQLLGAGAVPLSYLVAVPDGSATGYIVAGAILSQYLALGGPAGSLGYPLSDATTGGRQTFQQGTLAGNPVQLVTGAILAQWGALGYETGAAGSPTSAATSFLTFRGTAGSMQSFQGALIVAPTIGPLAGQAFSVTSPVLAQYSSSGGPSGQLGAPTDNVHLVNGLEQQDFEGGYINYAPGSTVVNLVSTPRQPLVTATPSSVISGTTVHLVVGGFNNNATVRVSQTGQPDFVVTVASGAYAWDTWVPAAAVNGVVTISATDVNSAATAQGTYTVRSASSTPLTISMVSGNEQNGAPGAQVAQPLVVLVQDQNGNPVPDQTVTFAASPGAQIVPASATTGANGHASATLRLPLTAGIALATATTGRQLVTFSARSAAFSLVNFPALTQAVSGTLGNGSDTILQKGALLTSAASILSYYQSLGELPQPSGLANPTTLNGFLKSFCVADSQGSQICDGFVSLGQSTEQTVNLWRLGAFTGNDLSVSIGQPSLSHISDLVASGSPVLLALSLNGLGSHFVVATGVASDGSLVIADPDPAFAQTNLNGYLNGFNLGGATIQGTLSGAVLLLPQPPASPGFLVVANAPAAVSSAAGSCGSTLQFPSIAAVAGTTPSSPPGTLYFLPCGGSSSPYQLDIAPQGAYNATFTDLSVNGGQTPLSGSAPASSLIVLNGSHWTLAPLSASVVSGGVVNAASGTSGIAPGGLISIYGAGFVKAGSATTIQINAETATVVAALPFLVNAQIPFDIAPGAATLGVTSGNGSVQQPVTIANVAPAIFSVAQGQAAITNQDNSLNTASNPALRGNAIVIYCTGLGAVSAFGTLSTANVPVSAVIGGVAIPAAFAGLTPGTTGLYQVNVRLPQTLPPGLSLPLYLQQASATSNTVTVAIQ